MMKKVFTSILCLIAMVHNPALAQTSHTVDVTNNVFTPDELTIHVGDTIVWTNSEGWHNVNGSLATYPSNPESFGNSTGSGWVYSHVFTLPGVYDYQCDPHVGFGMVGLVTVQDLSPDTLTINLSGMGPHVGQTGYVRVEDDDTGEEIERSAVPIEESFSLVIPGILPGHSYTVEIFADHNGNGFYDAPPTDHAWRIQLENTDGNEIVDFTHNTSFTDIEWDHRVFLNLSGMGPHLGQEAYFALIDAESGEIVDRKSETVEESFTVELNEIIPGKAYRVDFFSDHNDNGHYDAPPTDHAWRLEIPNASGDEVLDFVHNTGFTDIQWKHRLRVRFSEMGPHMGQMLSLYVKDASGNYLDTVVVDQIDDPDFDVKSHVIVPGNSYTVDFYADHNGNGFYDTPPADHAWRLETGAVTGDVDLEFSHNGGFTDIFSTTGINPDDRLIGLQIYPNPAAERVQIASDETIRSVAVYDITGARILQQDDLQTREHELSLESVSPGVYFVRIITADDRIKTGRFVKQ